MSEPEFTRPLRVDPLPRDGLEETVEATEAERQAVAKLNGLPAIARLTAKFRIAKWRRGVKVEGDVWARVTQTCVVSLEPFEADIEEPVELYFLPADAKAPQTEDETDGPDPLVGGMIDLGAVTSEFLTLALDPYPRKPGATFAAPADLGEDGSPFRGLKPPGEAQEPD